MESVATADGAVTPPTDERAILARRRWTVVKERKAGVVGLAILAVVIIVTVLAPVLSPADPSTTDLPNRLAPPVWIEGGTSEHPLGTDQLGRDTLSRLLHAGRWSLLAGFGATAGAALIGVTLGLMGGFYPKFGSTVLSFVVNVTMGFPFVVFAIAVLAFVGRDFSILLLVMALGGWPIYTRVIQAEVMRLRSAEYTLAATALGASGWRVLGRHLLPNLSDEILALASLQVAVMILSESFLSFLGFGVQPPAASWGSILSSGRAYLLDQWWLATFPGLAILVTTISVNLVGDTVSAVLSPYSQKRET